MCLPAFRKTKTREKSGRNKWGKNPTRDSQNSKPDIRRPEKPLENYKMKYNYTFISHFRNFNLIISV